MTTLATEKIRGLLALLFIDPPMVAADIIYLGAAVGLDSSGNARPLVAGDNFVGFAAENADNSAGLVNARRVHVAAQGGAWLSVTGINSIDDVPVAVFASDDDTFTTTAAGNSFVGFAIFYNTNDSLAFVQFQANKPIAAITDASVAHALNGTFSDTEVETALDALGTKINAILTALEAKGIIKTAGA